MKVVVGVRVKGNLGRRRTGSDAIRPNDLLTRIDVFVEEDGVGGMDMT
jgi:hypothetical protein